jgi:hypothetical protein
VAEDRDSERTYVANRLGRAVHVVSNENRSERKGSRNVHSLNSNGSAILNNHLVDFGVAGEIQVGVDRAGRMNVRVGAITTAAGLSNKVRN